MGHMAQGIMQVISSMEVFSMKKERIVPIIKIMIFSIIFVILFVSITYIMKPFSVDLQNIGGFYGEKKKSLDVVYIGGSACFVYWEPLKAYEENGIASYNFGANRIQAETYAYLVKEVLKKQNPEVIIIDARAFQYRDVDQPPGEIAYRNVISGTPFSLERAKFIETSVKKYLHQDTLSYHFDLIKFHTRRTDFHFKASIQLMMQTYQNSLKGFYFVPKVAPIQQLDFNTEKETSVSEETTQILDELLAYLKTTNQKYLFVVSPYEERKEHKENFNFVERKIKESGYDFLDANEYAKEMKLNYNRDFYNNNHVNIFGADKYTEFLSSYLKEHYQLPDRRKDSNYKKWDELLENWHKQVDETKKTIYKLIGE